MRTSFTTGWQFTLSKMLFAIALLAAFFGLWSHSSLGEAFGYVLCSSILWCGYRFWSIERFRALSIFAVLAAVLGLWFLVVDKSAFVDECLDCGELRDVVQIRVFRIPVRENVIDRLSTKARVAKCLGVICHHENHQRWQKTRYWGLVFCGCPCWNGTLSLEERWTPANEAAFCEAIRQIRLETPTLPDEFRTHVLHDHDEAYWKKLIEQIRNGL